MSIKFLSPEYMTEATRLMNADNAAAFMTGKLKVSGNVAKLMRAQGPLQKLQALIDALDVEY